MKIGFIGTGNMGGALARSVRRAIPGAELFLSDFDSAKARALAESVEGTEGDNLSLAAQCDLLFLGVKPQVLRGLLEEIRPTVAQRGTSLVLVTMAAGVSLSVLKEVLGENVPLIRIMPNTPVSVGKGVIVYCTENVSAEQEKAFAGSLSCAGIVEKIEESKMDAATALHGSGPAFAFLFVEALADGAVHCGLTREAALRFAAATVGGAAEMLLQTGAHPGTLKDAVCSPGGTTIEGVRAMEEAGFRGATMEAVLAAYRRACELGKKE